MAVTASSQNQDQDQPLSASQAMRRAWTLWTVFLVAPFIVFCVAVWQLLYDPTAVQQKINQSWFVANMVYLLLAVPGSFFVRSRIFRAYWNGESVAPADYIRGMMLVWLILVIGGIAALLGCMFSHSLLPNLLPALVAFFFFITQRPTGHAMTRPTGNVDDPGVYEDPS